MAPPEPPTEVTLKIKVPPGYLLQGGSDEFELGSFAVDTTVGAVRLAIQNLMPSRPAPNQQRLLHAGRALINNEQRLTDALNIRRDPSQKEYVVHLLVRDHAVSAVPVSQRAVPSISNGAAPSPSSDVPLGVDAGFPGTSPLPPAPQMPESLLQWSADYRLRLQRGEQHLPRDLQRLGRQHQDVLQLQQQLQQQAQRLQQSQPPLPLQQQHQQELQQLQQRHQELQREQQHIHQTQQVLQRRQLQHGGSSVFQVNQQQMGGQLPHQQNGIFPEAQPMPMQQQQQQPHFMTLPEQIMVREQMAHAQRAAAAQQTTTLTTPPHVVGVPMQAATAIPGLVPNAPLPLRAEVAQVQQQPQAFDGGPPRSRQEALDRQAAVLRQGRAMELEDIIARQLQRTPTHGAHHGGHDGQVGQDAGQLIMQAAGPTNGQPQVVAHQTGFEQHQHVPVSSENIEGAGPHAHHHPAPLFGDQGPILPGQPGQFQQQMQQHMPGRPISGQGVHVEGIGPNGQRFQYHQQTLQIPFGALPAHNVLGGMPIVPPIPHIGPFHPPPNPNQPAIQSPPQPIPSSRRPPLTALERARENLAESRRLLNEMRDNPDVAPEEQQRRVASLAERTQLLNDYIDPFSVGNAGFNSDRPPMQRRTGPSLFGRDRSQPFDLTPHAESSPFRTTIPSLFPPTTLSDSASQSNAANSNASVVTCHLLSSPEGPQALLFSPQHGTFTTARRPFQVTPLLPLGALPSTSTFVTPPQQVRPTPTTSSTQTSNAQRDDPVAAAARAHIQHGAVQQQQQQQQNGAAPAVHDPLAPLQPLIGHAWLMLRVLIFAYFLLGAGLGWRRPLALMVIGLGFWFIRAGMLGDGGVVRAWWEGVVGVQGPRAAGGAGVGAGAVAGGNPPAPLLHGVAAEAQAGMPTPEQLANRLMREEGERRRAGAGGGARWQRVREFVRPVERAAALFVASLWPGIGEAHVLAQEREDRRRAEEEVAARRREEEARVAREEREKQEAPSASTEVKELGQAGEGTAAVEGAGA